MARKLLPFEHELIKTLGISKDEYLEFVALYEHPDFKGQPTATGTEWAIALAVLSIVGTVATVVATLLSQPQTPAFEAPRGGGGQPQTRDERFSPRFGFNSVQELAAYGDPVNLVYANRGTGTGANPNGGVRVASSLLWSAVRSYGSSQFIQMLLMLAGGALTAIDTEKSAFGQTPLRDLMSNALWTYFRPSGTGLLQWQDEVEDKESTDPTVYGTGYDTPYRIQPSTANSRTDGFSQAYSPNTANTVGIYGVVPINVLLYLRNATGFKDATNLGISASEIPWVYGTGDYVYEGNEVVITFNTVAYDPGHSDTLVEAKEARRSVLSVFDNASDFKLGTALFRVLSITGNIETENTYVRLRCTRSGYSPITPYEQADAYGGGGGLPNYAERYGDYYTKALVKIATAQYETVSPCHIVDFALRATAYRRISGAQYEYGSNRAAGRSVADNGIKNRTSLFVLRYKQAGTSRYTTVPAIFAISRAADNENYIYFRFNSNMTNPNSATHWVFELEPVSDPHRETEAYTTYNYLENNGDPVTYALPAYIMSTGATIYPTIEFTGLSLAAVQGFGRSSPVYPPFNRGPAYLTEWDLFNYDSDHQIQFSFDAGPEITITSVTEQLIQPFSDFPQLYNNLSLIGFNAYSGKTIQDLRSFTVFATQGRSVRRLRTSGSDEYGIPWGNASYTYYPASPDGASSLAPDIFLDTVLDKEDGIGNYAVVNALDLKQLAITKRFCIANNLFMDCVIADPRSWREFWVEVAPYNLLEFARIGGRETLVPAVPYDTTTGQISRTINITALFNQGNILEDSYKEEYIDYGSNAQDIIANIIYTDMPDNAVFAKKKSVEVVLKDTVEVDAIRQTFDISSYVSNYSHAVLFGKLLCNSRRYVRQAIEFKTYPTSDPIFPGAYVYVDIGQNAWDAIRTGVVGKDGTLNTPLASNPADGTYNFRLYRSDKGMVSLNGVTVINGVSSQLTSYEGYLFVLGVEATTRRVFRVTEVQMDEEGEITIRATIYPCTTDGLSLIANFSDGLFTVRS